MRRKLARVLWIPVLGLREVALAERRAGAPLLWSPSEEQEAALRFDWEELAGMIGRGDIERVTGRLGRYLQVRPKAAHGGVRRRSIDTEGRMIETLPRGFYLRTQFTARALDNSLIMAEANLAGHPPYAPYAGRFLPATGRIIDHNGDIIAQTGRRHGVAIANVDLDAKPSRSSIAIADGNIFIRTAKKLYCIGKK